MGRRKQKRIVHKANKDKKVVVTMSGDFYLPLLEERCTCPPRLWYNPIADGRCVICGKQR